MSGTDTLNTAARYLQQCTEMRCELGISSSQELAPHFLGQGEHNQNFWFEDVEHGKKYVLRVNVVSQPFHKDQIGYEYAALTALEQCGRAPKPLYQDKSHSILNYDVMIISFCEGSELDFDHLRPGDLRCAAQLMADIHAVPVADNCTLYRPKDPLNDLFNECIQRYEFYRKSAFEDTHITAWVERFIAAAKPALEIACSSQDCNHIINTETLPSHFLIPKESVEAAAANSATSGAFCENPGYFVDWERPIIGEPAQDVAYFVAPTTTFWDSKFLFPVNQVDDLLEDYWRAVDGRFDQGSFDARFKAYRMMTALRSTTWCCKALVQYNTDGAYKTQKTADKLPVYLSDEFLERLMHDCF